MVSTSSSQSTSMQICSSEAYQIKGRTMKLEEDDLFVQVENLVDIDSLKHHGFDLSNYLLYQDLGG